jgi:hypothetical protein
VQRCRLGYAKLEKGRDRYIGRKADRHTERQLDIEMIESAGA